MSLIYYSIQVFLHERRVYPIYQEASGSLPMQELLIAGLIAYHAGVTHLIYTRQYAAIAYILCSMQEWLIAYNTMQHAHCLYTNQVACRSGSLPIILGSMQDWLIAYILDSMQEWLIAYILDSMQEQHAGVARCLYTKQHAEVAWLVAYILQVACRSGSLLICYMLVACRSGSLPILGSMSSPSPQQPLKISNKF